MDEPLVDRFGRSFTYLRLSVEDACNFRCLYCLPKGYRAEGKEPPLSPAEIRRLVAGFAGMGMWKVRLTGGEPTVRRDIVELAAAVAGTPGVRRVSLSTNGYRLVELAAELRSAGVASVNVSVDSLDRDRFRQITGHDRLAAVLAGVERCLELGFETKVNVVLMKDLNEAEADRFVGWTRDTPVGVRFIELMPTGDNLALFSRRHVSAGRLVEKLSALGWSEQARREGDGPARKFGRVGHRGTVGVIAPYSKDFCASCNRLRVTSRGDLRLCLFAEGDASLRAFLQSDDQRAALQAKVRALLDQKEATHYLPEGRLGNTKHFAMMGG
jgi:GTP 3',8-cyclase